LLLSNYEAHGRDFPAGADPFSDANAYDSVEQLAVGNNAAAGYFAPTLEVDRPFKSFKVELVVAGTIDDTHFSFGRHGVG
jgi:hypothetical protein